MITYYDKSINTKLQINIKEFYDKILAGLNIFSIECSCCTKGQMIKYGHYKRMLKTSDGPVSLSIQRFKCKHCGRTHAFLLSCMIPYSQIMLHDMISIIKSRSAEEIKNIMNHNPSIDESNISYVKRQYKMHWEQRILSEHIKMDDGNSLSFQCFYYFDRQFMQIKCTKNQLYTLNNITSLYQLFLFV